MSSVSQLGIYKTSWRGGGEGDFHLVVILYLNSVIKQINCVKMNNFLVLVCWLVGKRLFILV